MNKRRVLRETPVETEDGHNGQAEQLTWLIFPPHRKSWGRVVIFGLFSGVGSIVHWILNKVLLLLAVTVLAAAIGIAVCVILYRDTPWVVWEYVSPTILYQDTPWVVWGYVPPTIQCASEGTYRESVRKTKDWWYSKQEKDTRENYKETMDELNRLAATLKEGTIDFATVRESMLEELGKKSIKDIDAKDLSKSIDKWLEETKSKGDKDTGQKPPVEEPKDTGVAKRKKDSPVEPANAKARQQQIQIQKIVQGFFAMQPDENVLIPLQSFRDVIMPQLNTDLALGKTTITVRNEGFLSGGNEEKINVSAFLKSPKSRQFETIWRVACGRKAASDTANQTSQQKQIVAACKAFKEQIEANEKKKQPDAKPPKQ